jgi:serine/threonine-protein kinase
MTRTRRLLTILVLVAVTSAACRSETVDPPAPTNRATPAATLELPIDGSSVHQCAVFTGTADLPADKTLVLSMRNLDNHDPAHYFSAVRDYDYPDELRAWTGYQWFGSRDSSVGQRYRVELLIVDLTLVQAALASAPKDGWSAPENPPGSIVAAHITLTRVAGPGPAVCS